jgi:hypothetical protein
MTHNCAAWLLAFCIAGAFPVIVAGAIFLLLFGIG